MPLAVFFWVLFILWILSGAYRSRADYWGLGAHGLLAVLIFLLGWSTFGAMVK